MTRNIYKLNVTETYNRVITVGASSLEEAIEIAEEKCNSGEIDLTYSDFLERSIEPYPIESDSIPLSLPMGKIYVESFENRASEDELLFFDSNGNYLCDWYLPNLERRATANGIDLIDYINNTIQDLKEFGTDSIRIEALLGLDPELVLDNPQKVYEYCKQRGDFDNGNDDIENNIFVNRIGNYYLIKRH